MSENLALWNLVEKTDPAQVKPITGKPYKGSSPKPHWLIQKATETFGPCGIGWGFHVVSERVEDGAQGDKVHIAHIRVWYKWKGERGEVEHVGQTMFAGKNKNGPFTDEDAPKKSVTDAMVKALSMIGFAGDIFMGRYDDSKYIAELREEFAQASTETRPEKQALSDMELYVRDALIIIDEWGSDLTNLKTWWDDEAPYRKGAGIADGSAAHKQLLEAYQNKSYRLNKSPPPKATTRTPNPLSAG